MKLKEFFKKHKKKCIIITLVIIAVIIGSVVFFNIKNAKPVEEDNRLIVETVTRQTISNYVSMTGSIAANDSQTVYSNANGLEVLAVNVEVGDAVKKGDVIAVLDSSDIEDKLVLAQKELSVQQAQTALKLQQAQRNVNNALVDAQDTAKEAQTDVDNAAKDYGYQLGDKENVYSDYQDAIDDYEDAKKDYENVRKKYSRLKNGDVVTVDGESYDPKDDTAQSQLKKVVDQYKSAKEAAEDKMESAERQLKSANESAERTYRSYDSALEKQADAAVDTQRKLQNAQDDLSNEQLSASVASNQMENQIKEYQKQIDKCTITAPISGVITSVSMEVGDETDSDNNVICVIQDTTGYKVEGTVDEYDISKIAEGMSVVVKTEATGDEEMTGKVSFVSPTPKSTANSTQSTSSSAAVYPIKVTLDGITEKVRIGMTAETNILIDTAEDVLTVPYDCIVEKEDGTCVIYAVREGEPAAENNEAMPEQQTESRSTDNRTKNNADKNKKGGRNSGMMRMGAKKSDDAAGQSGSAEELGREIVVTKGLETDYYTEISGEGVTEGLKVYVSGTTLDDGAMSVHIGGPGF